MCWEARVEGRIRRCGEEGGGGGKCVCVCGGSWDRVAEAHIMFSRWHPHKCSCKRTAEEKLYQGIEQLFMSSTAYKISDGKLSSVLYLPHLPNQFTAQQLMFATCLARVYHVIRLLSNLNPPAPCRGCKA